MMAVCLDPKTSNRKIMISHGNITIKSLLEEAIYIHESKLMLQKGIPIIKLTRELHRHFTTPYSFKRKWWHEPTGNYQRQTFLKEDLYLRHMSHQE